MLARWYKTGNCAVEAVDLGRREERTRRSNEGDKRGSSSLPPSFSLTLFLFLSLSASRALPFESPRHKRISTRQRSYSPLNRASSRRAFVAPPSFILVSSLRAERSGDEKSFILADGGPSRSHRRRGGAQFFLLYLSFLPFLPPPPSWTTQSRSPPFLSFSPLAPFFHCLSLLSLSLVISNISPVLLFLYFCSYRSSYATFFSLVLSMPLFPFYFFPFLSLPILSVLLLLLYLYSSRKIQARIFFSFRH